MSTERELINALEQVLRDTNLAFCDNLQFANKARREPWLPTWRRVQSAIALCEAFKPQPVAK